MRAEIDQCSVVFCITSRRVRIDLRPYEDIEALKQQVETTLRGNNQELLRQNCGVVDIIARCLRFSHKGRIENAAQLLRDIDTFDVCAPSRSVAKEARVLLGHARTLDASKHSLLGWLAVMQLRDWRGTIDNMARGVYDLRADADTMRGMVAGLMSILTPGDEFLTISLPKFWWQDNIGINGRFLSKCKEAAQRGVKIRRVFLLEDTLSEPGLGQVVAAQQRVAMELTPALRQNYSVRCLSSFEG